MSERLEVETSLEPIQVLQRMAELVDTAQSEWERQQLLLAIGLETCRYFKAQTEAPRP